MSTISSAKPHQLYHYARVASHLNSEMSTQANRLASVLCHFESTCSESSFALHVSYLADELRGYAHWATPIDDWVREVGKGFERADSRRIVDIVRGWIRDLLHPRVCTVFNPWKHFMEQYTHRAIRVSGDSVLGVQATHLVATLFPSSPTKTILLSLPLWLMDMRNQGALQQAIINIESLVFRFKFSLRVIGAVWENMAQISNALKGGILDWIFGEPVAGGTYANPPLAERDYLKLDLESLGRPANFQDIAATIEQMYRKKDNEEDGFIDDAVQIVQIGEHDWLVLVIGTDSDDVPGINNWYANLSTGLGVPSSYQLYVQKLIEESGIPAGANINLAGHSMGGYVIMGIAGTQSITDKYHISSVTTFGTGVLPNKNPNLDDDVYHNFVLQNDPIQAHVGPGVHPDVIEEGRWTLHITDGHAQYHLSETLADIEVPYKVERWENAHFFTATQEDLEKIGLRLDPMSALCAGEGNVFDASIHLVYVLDIAATEYVVEKVDDILPSEWQIEIDRVFDFYGTLPATIPPPSEVIFNVATTIQDSVTEAYNRELDRIEMEINQLSQEVEETTNSIRSFLGI